MNPREFKQAARAVGVSQNALELGLQYAKDRSQFGKPIIKFSRIFNKLAWMVMETTVARQITLFSAREKDNDIRCDIEAVWLNFSKKSCLE